jgi:hypothetical protein
MQLPSTGIGILTSFATGATGSGKQAFTLARSASVKTGDASFPHLISLIRLLNVTFNELGSLFYLSFSLNRTALVRVTQQAPICNCNLKLLDR